MNFRLLNMKTWCYLIIFLATSAVNPLAAQQEELDEGNRLLESGKFTDAERVFRTGTEQYPNHRTFKTQLAYSLIQQKRYDEAEELLFAVIKEYPTDMPANWYAGVLFFYREQNRSAITRFEKAIMQLRPGMGQFASACWFIGRCYQNMLFTEGITQKETDRMFEVYDTFLELRPDSPEADEIRTFLEEYKPRRPEEEGNLWLEIVE